MLLLALRRLDRRRFAPVALCPAGELAGRIGELGIPVKTVNRLEARFTWRPDRFIKYLISFVRTSRDLRKKILREKCDLIHANSIRAGLVATAAGIGTKTPVFWHLQDELPRHPVSTLIRLFVLFSSRTRLIAASAATANSFRGKILGKRRIPLRVVHNGIELEKFTAQPAGRSEIRRELELSEEEFVLGIVGQITPRKGQLELIRTFAEILPEMPAATLLIAGAPLFNRDHEYLRQIEAAVRESALGKKIKLLGQRQDVPAVMAALDALVVNSTSEALVVVAIEAMACGTPVIATDVGGTCEMIRHRQNGLLVPAGDRKLLAEAIVELGRDPDLRRRIGAAGKKSVTENLNAEKFISGLEDFFSEFAPAGKKPEGALLFGEN